MLNAVREEMRKIRNQPVFLYMLGTTSLLSISSFLFEIISRWSVLDIKQFASIESWMFNQNSAVFFIIFQLCIFFAVPLTANGRYFEELKGGIHPLIYTRFSYDRYILTKVISYAITAFYLIFLPVMINVMLCTLCFPAESYANPGLQLASRGVFVWGNAYVVPWLYERPLLMAVYYAFNMTFLAWICGVASLLLNTSFRKNRLISIFYPVLLLMAVSLLLELLGFSSPIYIIITKHTGSGIKNALSVYPCAILVLYTWYAVLKRKQPIL